MTTTQHTPGPWYVDPCGSIYPEQKTEIDFGGSTGKQFVQPRIATIDGYETIARSGRKNARLIAAAPELLEALQKAAWLIGAYDLYRGAGCSAPSSWTIDDQTRRQQAINTTRIAIAKATGE